MGAALGAACGASDSNAMANGHKQQFELDFLICTKQETEEAISEQPVVGAWILKDSI